MLKRTVYYENWDSLNWILMSDFSAIYKLSLLCEVKTINWGNFYNTKPLGPFLFLFCSEPIIKINVVPKFCLNPLDIRGIYINCLQKLFLLCVFVKRWNLGRRMKTFRSEIVYRKGDLAPFLSDNGKSL